MHERTHNEALTEKRGDIIITRGMSVFSRRYGVSGKCDILEFHRSKTGFQSLVGTIFGCRIRLNINAVSQKRTVAIKRSFALKQYVLKKCYAAILKAALYSMVRTSVVKKLYLRMNCVLKLQTLLRRCMKSTVAVILQESKRESTVMHVR